MGSSQWRKSSYSGNTGGECVECAPLGNARWRKASYSGSNGGDCLEVAENPCTIAVRDSKNPAHGTLSLSREAWHAFVDSVVD
ncbi:DUF397 domain-containing protein [Streptomyces sp. NPDC058739]|uniref:DUF397 domain-containing protein n=1 Tax=Streptomyces sp. NPDC058739 TaxID=3346618 RepID=UPI0036D18808